MFSFFFRHYFQGRWALLHNGWTLQTLLKPDVSAARVEHGAWAEYGSVSLGCCGHRLQLCSGPAHPHPLRGPLQSLQGAFTSRQNASFCSQTGSDKGRGEVHTDCSLTKVLKIWTRYKDKRQARMVEVEKSSQAFLFPLSLHLCYKPVHNAPPSSPSRLCHSGELRVS